MSNTQKQERSRSIFEMIFCCGNNNDVEAPKSKQLNTFYSVTDYLKQNPQKDRKYYNLGLHNGFFVDKLKKIKSKTNLKDLKICNTNENDQTQYPCPICFRFFNIILVSQCCGNYICHLCALEYRNLKCHFCSGEDCKYRDVDQDNELKIYTDSQGMQKFKKQEQKSIQ